ncbi:hypothetical protein vseg_015849 [Gypsophila vaccaria]
MAFRFLLQMTREEAFRSIFHAFHGKGPGKKKQEKRMKQYQDEQKLKQMTTSDVLPQSVERMREAQMQLRTPYLVLSGNARPAQTSNPRGGFATVEKDILGSLTPPCSTMRRSDLFSSFIFVSSQTMLWLNIRPDSCRLSL